MLTQLVQQDQITRKPRAPRRDAAATRYSVTSFSASGSGRTMNRFWMPELHIVDQLFQLRFQAGHLHRLSPRLLRVRQILAVPITVRDFNAYTCHNANTIIRSVLPFWRATSTITVRNRYVTRPARSAGNNQGVDE